MTDLQWRWEFLRRRPDYREVWISNYDQCQAKYDRMVEEQPHLDRELYRAVGPTYRSVCEPFGVNRIMAPWCEYSRLGTGFWKPSFGWSLGTISGNVPLEGLVEQSEEWHDRGVTLFAFDLNRPFDEQLPHVRSHFEAIQKERLSDTPKTGRRHLEKWPKYLRAIDARDQEATYADLYLEIELAGLSRHDYDAALDRNLAASGLQIFKQAQDLMFKVTS